MKSRWLVWACAAVAVAFMGGLAANAADGGQANVKPPAKPAVPSFKGVVSAKPADAAADVVAVLAAKVKGEEKKLNLLAKDDTVKAKIEELAAKNASVMVKGELSADGAAVTVASIAEAVAKPPKAPKAQGAAKSGEAAPQPGE